MIINVNLIPSMALKMKLLCLRVAWLAQMASKLVHQLHSLMHDSRHLHGHSSISNDDQSVEGTVLLSNLKLNLGYHLPAVPNASS